MKYQQNTSKYITAIINKHRADLTRYSNESQTIESLLQTQTLPTLTESKVEPVVTNRESVASSLLESARKLKTSKPKSESAEEDEMLIDDNDGTSLNETLQSPTTPERKRSPLYSHESKPRQSPVPTPGTSPRPLRKKSP